MAGPEKKSRKVTDMDRKLVAYHEGGHAIVAHYIPECDDVHEITTIPRGAAGGYTMMKTAADKLRAEADAAGIVKPKLIAITVLTSINQAEWCGALKIPEQVVEFAKLAKSAGLDGVVASPQEAAVIRENCGEDFLIVTPGIRPAGSDINDQSRISTPAAAIRNGANYLVVGRPIRAADNPRDAAEKILAEISEV